MRRPPGHYRLRQSTRGELNPRAKLDSAKVEEIKRSVEGGESMAAVARRLGIGETAVNKVIWKERWVYGEERRVPQRKVQGE